MNNKIVSTTKKISTIFFAIVLVTGTLALSSQSSFMVVTNAQAQPYYDGGMDRYDDNKSYGMDSYGSSNYGNDNSYEQSQYQPSYEPDYKPQYPSYGKDDKRDKSQKDITSVSINKLKCINNNININGNNTGNINIGNKGKVGAEEGGYSGAYSSDSGSGYGGSEGYDGYKKDKGFDCVINNNNTNINGGGNQTIPPVPPVEKATLNVTKLVTCEERKEGSNGLIPPVIGPSCVDLLGNITEDQFNITVTDTNVSPSSFNGSEAGTIVTLDAGSYTVTETFDASIAADLAALGGNITGPNITFTGQCTQTGVNSTSATGTIAAGESQTCNIVNQFVINVDPCEQCFLAAIGPANLVILENFLAQEPPGEPETAADNLEEYCALIAGRIAAGGPGNTIEIIAAAVLGDLAQAGITISVPVSEALVRCIALTLDTAGRGIVSFDVSGVTADSPTMAQETQLSAVEKMTKLKQQWLDLLP